MRISLNWLQELVDVQLSPDDLAEALTMAGFEVEDIEDRRTWAKGVVVGYVEKREPHPDADKLSVCQVDIGAGTPSTIVCGAANVGAGMFVPVAQVDSYLPAVDLTIKSRQVRGVLSAGMICSLAELGLEKDSSGIHIFTQGSVKPGEDVRPLLGLNDVVLDLTSTANRADALSMVGIAREVAAITGAPLSLPEPPEIAATSAPHLQVQLQDEKACPIYIVTTLTDIHLGDSPQWLQQRLQSAGIRPISNIVDITNYVLLEWGQPLHAFDHEQLQRLPGGPDLTIGVRYGQSQETLTTLDGQERTLQPETLVITANDQAVALAGVMGGEATEVSDTTRAVMLEAAYFDGAVIRRSARSQGLRTEASARYERGVNPAELVLACRRAVQLMQELAGAQVAGQEVDRTAAGRQEFTRTLELRLGRVGQILGPVTDRGAIATIPPERTREILEALGCQVTAKRDDRWQVQVPPSRYRDLEREIDLVEEIARLYGYDNFANTLPGAAVGGYLSPTLQLARRLRAACRAAGLTELMHYSVTKPTRENQVVLANPLFPEYSALRTDLIDGLLEAFEFNLNQGNGPLHGFEIGHIFWRDDSGLHESEAVGGILGGDIRQGIWVNGGQPQPLSWYEAKGVLESIFQRLGLAVDYRADSRDARFHPGRTASLWVRGRQPLGIFGQLHPQLRQQRELPEDIYLFQLDWHTLVTCLGASSQKAVKFAAYSAFPASDRDLAFFASVAVATADLQKAMAKAGGKLLESVTLFDEYRGESVPAGERSLAFRLVYRSADRTLTDSDIEPVHQKVRQTLEKQFKVTLRS